MFAYGFEELQLAGLQPSLLANKLHLPAKTLSLLFLKIRLLPNGCWEWTAAKQKGYGAVRIRALSSSILRAHRVCYELVNGQIEPGLDIHHKVEDGCIGRACCNPAHLQTTTKADHIRDLTPGSVSYINSRKEMCSSGHLFTIENTHITKTGIRQCRTCGKIRAQERRDALRVRPKYAKDPEKLKTECFRGHSLIDESNIRWVPSPTGKQKVCLACEAIRLAAYQVGEKAPALPADKCKRGHSMTGDNVYQHPDGIRRSCRSCRDLNFRKRETDPVEETYGPDFSIEDGEWEWE